MESGIQMFTTDSVSTISSGKIVAQTSTFEQTSMTDDDPGIRIIGDNKVELVYKNKVTNEEASIDLYNSNNSSNNAKLYIDNPRGTTSLIIDQNRRLGVGNIVPEAILHLHNHNNSNSEHIRVTNNDNLGMNMILTSSNTDIKVNFGIRWYNSGSTTLVNNALVIRNLNGTNTIGIGTSTPSYTLDVSGNINFTGTLTQNGSTYTGSYTLPIASSSTLGGIKIGNNLSINGSGVVSATDTNTTYSVGDGGLTQNNFTNTLKTKLDGIASSANNYSLPAATSSSLGGIKVGTNLSIDSGTGVLSATDTNTTYSVGDGGLTQNNFTNTLKSKLDGIATSANNYTLPTAASDTLGGVKVGTNLSISSGVLSATDTNTTYSVGDGGLTQNNFTDTLKSKLDGIATSANNYSLPTSSTSTLGGVKVDGSTITINGSGVISSSVGTLSSLTVSGDATFDTSTLKVDSSNNRVGIGTSSPGEKLDVSGVTITEGLQVISSDVNNNNLTRPAIATRSSTSGIKDYEISAIPNYYATRSSNYTADNGFLRIRAGGGTNANQTSYIDLSGYSTSGYEDMLSNIVLGTSGTERMRIDKDGNVGIGTSSPNCALEVHGGSGSNDEVLILSNKKDLSASEYHSIFTLGGHHYDVYYNSTIQDGKSTNNGTVFHINYYSGGNVCLCGNGNGRVGIGTPNPGFPLHVYGSVSAAAGSVGYIDSNGVSTSNATDDPIGLKVQKVIWSAMYIMANSDRRIKENIEDVPDNQALEMLRNIPCRYYEYKDKLGRGSYKTIGFIAQEVKSVLPMAVSIQTEIIPNVYTNILDVTWEEITETNAETGLETKKYKMRTSTITPISGVKYKFYVSNTNDNEVEKIVTGNDDSTFTFGQQWTNVFCYGREVEDFHTLDKNKLFALNFSATQEIDRIQQQELTKVKDLEIENFLLKERVKDLESKMNDVLNRLTQLENNSH